MLNIIVRPDTSDRKRINRMSRFRFAVSVDSCFFSSSLLGKSGIGAERRLRNGNDVREPVCGGDQGPVGGCRYTGMLRS